jgi:hypothetical protein
MENFREQEWIDAEDEQLRRLGLDEDSQNQDNPEYWIENSNEDDY